MNLHAIVSPLIAAVNPMRTATIAVNRGYTTLADGTRAPVMETPVSIQVQVQELSSKDLMMTAGINIGGETKKIYLNGNWNGVIRPDGRGGDVLIIDGQTWLITKQLENWEGEQGWTAVLATRQNS